MGRTLPSFRIAHSIEAAEWAPFRRALPKGERRDFDAMLDESKFHSMAASMAVRPLRLEGVFMALLFHHYVELTESSNALEEVRLKTKLPRSKPNK